MFIGHFAIGSGAKSLAPRVSLGSLFVAAQFIDLLWPSLLLLGVEGVRIAPGATAVTPLLFEHYPYSHSLLAVVAWALLLGAGYFILRRERLGALGVGVMGGFPGGDLCRQLFRRAAAERDRHCLGRPAAVAVDPVGLLAG